MTSDSLLAARGVGWAVDGVEVLGPLDVDVPEGRRTVVLGPNGAGKTTLLRVLTGLLPPSRGEVRWRGRSLEELSRRELARRIAWLPQILPARSPFRVEELVLLGRHPHLSPWQLEPTPGDRAAVEQALERVDGTRFVGRMVETLSGGERQLIHLAAALAQDAPLLVLDEPTAHLDPHYQLRIARVLEAWRRDGGTVLMATHDLALAGAVADLVLLVAAGRCVTSGPPAEVLVRERLEEVYRAPFRVDTVDGRPRPLLELGG